MPTLNIFRSLDRLLRGQAQILSEMKEIFQLMSTQPTSLQFSDLQASINQLVNDNTANNNAVSAQIKEVQQLLLDYAAAVQQGSGPSQADLQQAISQLAAADSLVKQNTAAIQASASSITEGDPNATPPPETTPVEENQTPAGPATVGENTASGRPI